MCQRLATNVSRFYARNSRGQLTLRPIGRYLYSRDGNVIKLDGYGDRDSVMSRAGSQFLTAPQ